MGKTIKIHDGYKAPKEVNLLTLPLMILLTCMTSQKASSRAAFFLPDGSLSGNDAFGIAAAFFSLASPSASAAAASDPWEEGCAGEAFCRHIFEISLHTDADLAGGHNTV
jgi:hypothetical protein